MAVLWYIICGVLLLRVSEGEDLKMRDRRTEFGYPVGYMPKCRGWLKPADIPRKQLKHLAFVVTQNSIPVKWYNYFHARELANDPRIDFRRRTLLFVTGYLDNVGLGSLAYAGEYTKNNYNVILLDYMHWVTIHYSLSSRMMRPIGKYVAEVLVQLMELGLDPSKLEILGLSMGGQAIGYIAKNFQQMSGRNVSRITSLEPSGPCFRSAGPEHWVGPGDADFVDVIHTNMDVYSMPNRMGHVDIYINGGEYQPSDITLFPCTHICSHIIASGFWYAALKYPKKFIAIKCDSIQQARDHKCFDRTPMETTYFGLITDRTKHGIYYLATSENFPFYLGENGLKPEYVVWKRLGRGINEGNKTEVYV